MRNWLYCGLTSGRNRAGGAEGAEQVWLRGTRWLGGDLWGIMRWQEKLVVVVMVER